MESASRLLAVDFLEILETSVSPSLLSGSKLSLFKGKLKQTFRRAT